MLTVFHTHRTTERSVFTYAPSSHIRPFLNHIVYFILFFAVFFSAIEATIDNLCEHLMPISAAKVLFLSAELNA